MRTRRSWLLSHCDLNSRATTSTRLIGASGRLCSVGCCVWFVWLLLTFDFAGPLTVISHCSPYCFLLSRHEACCSSVPFASQSARCRRPAWYGLSSSSLVLTLIRHVAGPSNGPGTLGNSSHLLNPLVSDTVQEVVLHGDGTFRTLTGCRCAGVCIDENYSDGRVQERGRVQVICRLLQAYGRTR